MKLSEGNVRKATRKAATIAYLESLPSDHLFAPDSPCACMYHDLLIAQFGVTYVWPTFEEIAVGELEVAIGMTSFASRFQRAAIAFLGQSRRDDPRQPMRNDCATITRDEAIEIAKGVAA